MKYIQLSKRSKRLDKHYAIVDDEDFEPLNRYRWSYIKHRDGGESAYRKDGKSTIYMHRQIMNSPTGLEVDHRDRDRLNNQRSNLRLATRSQNATNKSIQSNNTSGYRGVYWLKRDKKWLARVGINGKFINAGLFKDKRQAALAYNKKAIELFGEFAVPNEL